MEARVCAVVLMSILSAVSTVAAAQQVSDIPTAIILVQECDAASPAFQAFPPAAPSSTFFDEGKCIQITDLGTIATKRYALAPSGQFNFQFLIFFSEQNRLPTHPGDPYNGPQLHATFKITVEATSRNGQRTTNSGSLVLYGSQAPDAPAGAKLSGQQATTGGFAYGAIGIPINVDWAASAVTFTVQAAQGIGSNTPILESCTTAAERAHGETCAFPWINNTVMSGPDLTSANPDLTLPPGLINSEFLVFILPAARFQLPVVPVAIVYAPLGNGKSASSSYTLSLSTGTTMQIGNTNSATTSWTSDDKTTFGGTFTVSDIDKSNGITYTGTGTWDNSVETDHQQSYGISSQIINNDQITQTIVNPPFSTAPLPQITYQTQPFWGDLVVSVLNAQFAIWDYPAGAVIQPLGSATTLTIPILQLDACASSPTALQTTTPNSTNQSHFLPYPSSTAINAPTQYVWLTSDDCSNIANMDNFYAQKSQASRPLYFRLLKSGGYNTTAATTISSKDSTQAISGQSSSMQSTTKVTASQSLGLGATDFGTAKLEYVALSWTGSGNVTNTGTQVTSTGITYSAQSASTVQEETDASTTFQDTSGVNAPVNIYQDLVFQGIAVQDTDMQYIVLPIIAVCCAVLPSQFSRLPMIDWRRRMKTAPAYVLKSPFGNTIIRNPSNPALVTKQLQNERVAAARRHIARPIPVARAGGSVKVTSEQLSKTLQGVRRPSKELSAILKAIQSTPGTTKRRD